MEEVCKWSAALTEAGEVSGYDLASTGGNEAKLVRLIVERILSEVNKTSLRVAKHPVGLDSRIADVEEMIDVEDNNVRMVGIHGMGGIGKTTLAKAVYNQIYTRFDASSFIANVREAGKQSTGLVSLQEKLIRVFFNDENVNVSSIDQGIEIIQKRIRSKKVLLVLDDVDHESQLDALVGSLDWFCSGSRIIVTTRDKGALREQRVNLYELKELDAAQSLRLFSWHAFGKEKPDAKFAELSTKVASIASGLPLALKVFGPLFRGRKTDEEWETMLARLKATQDKGIYEKLKTSYDVLEEEEKNVFLDIACFFVREGREHAALMWRACGLFPETTIEVLKSKCLVSINDDSGEFEMHDQIRDMGRKIVKDESPNSKPKMRSRLWKTDEALDVLQNKTGTEKIEAIQLNSGAFDKHMYVEAESFVAMTELRMLRLGEYMRLKGEFQHFPKKLRWLQGGIEGHLDSLPDGLHLENIVVLDLSRSSITQLWNPQGLESTKVFGKMKVLKLAKCRNLTICPDFTSMPHLEKLNFGYCKKMSELHPSIGLLKGLTQLYLSSCESLKQLPKEVWQLTSLEEFVLSHCCGITTLPSQMEDPKSLKPALLGKLKVLNFEGCSNLTICPDFTSMPHLEKLDFSGCKKMSELHPSIWQLTSLEQLGLSDCSEITTLPSQMEDPKSLKPVLLGKLKVLNFWNCSNLTICPDFTSMPHLEKLNFGYCEKMSELHPSIGLLKRLTHLNLWGCKSLKQLPKEVWQLSSLEELVLRNCSGITTLPSQMEDPKSLKPVLFGNLKVLNFEGCHNLTICPDFTSMPHLEKLNFGYCKKMSELHPSIWQLTSLEQLVLEDCSEITTLPSQMEDPKSLKTVLLGKLKVLYFGHCSNLTICPDFTSVPHLEELDFSECEKMSELHPSIGLLKRLTHLLLKNCVSLKELPQEVSQLTSLIRLDLTGCYQISALPESMRHLKQLNWLSLQKCSSLTEIPQWICSFLDLEILDASYCQRIAFLPNWIGKLKSLIQLDLRWTAIEELPHSTVSLENLEILSVSHCGKLEDIPGIKEMKLLRGLDLGGCRSLRDSFLERLQEANFQNLEYFSIPGRRLLSHPQSLSFLLPKQFECGFMFLLVDKSSLDNICSELDESNGSELVYRSIPSDEVIDSRPGRAVLIEITTGDAKFQFSALIGIESYEIGEGYELRELPTATFERDSELMRMAKQGEFNGNGDAQQRTMVTMRVSIDGCDLRDGDLFTYTEKDIDWLYPDPIEADYKSHIRKKTYSLSCVFIDPISIGY